MICSEKKNEDTKKKNIYIFIIYIIILKYKYI